VFPLIGAIALKDVTIAHAMTVMAALPSTMAKATRRHVAMVLNRLLNLAVYPGMHIEKNPLPKGWLPKLGKTKALTFLYPDEDTKLMRTTAIDVPARLLYGFLTREGMRRGEAGRLTWADLDLARGAVKLDVNKTEDPRAWALDPGVVRALATYRRLFAALHRPIVFSSTRTATGSSRATTRRSSSASVATYRPRVSIARSCSSSRRRDSRSASTTSARRSSPSRSRTAGARRGWPTAPATAAR
jgi:integrase